VAALSNFDKAVKSELVFARNNRNIKIPPDRGVASITGQGNSGFLHTISRQFPPSQVKRGGHDLERARKTTRESKSDLSESDRNIIEERMTL
jgi:hypothetical protein